MVELPIRVTFSVEQSAAVGESVGAQGSEDGRRTTPTNRKISLTVAIRAARSLHGRYPEKLLEHQNELIE